MPSEWKDQLQPNVKQKEGFAMSIGPGINQASSNFLVRYFSSAIV